MNFIKHLLVITVLSVASFSQAEESNKADIQNKVKTVQAQLDELVDRGGKYAYLQLAQKNRLSPFAVAVDKKGDVIMLEVPKNEKDASVAQKVLVLRDTLQKSADKGVFEAAALFVQAEVPHLGRTVSGVAIEMEHKEGVSVLRFSQYEIDRANKKITFKQPVDKIKPVVFFKNTKQK